MIPKEGSTFGQESGLLITTFRELPHDPGMLTTTALTAVTLPLQNKYNTQLHA